jgi:hypothetical protein
MLGTVESASAAALSRISCWILVGQFPPAIISMSLPFNAIAPAASTSLESYCSAHCNLQPSFLPHRIEGLVRLRCQRPIGAKTEAVLCWAAIWTCSKERTRSEVL